MQIKVSLVVNSDEKISNALKSATELAKNKQLNEAIDLLKRTLEQISKSNTGYSGSTYTKIIPYFEKAGRYGEVENYCLRSLIPLVSKKAKKDFSHKSSETQQAFAALHISEIYNKLALCAKRQKIEKDRIRFAEQETKCFTQYKELLELGDKKNYEQDYKKSLKIFGSNTSKWPRSIKSKFGIS